MSKNYSYIYISFMLTLLIILTNCADYDIIVIMDSVDLASYIYIYIYKIATFENLGKYKFLHLALMLKIN